MSIFDNRAETAIVNKSQILNIATISRDFTLTKRAM